MTSSRALSIWLRPCAEQADKLAAVINRLSAAHGTPPFPPHVTVIGNGDAANIADVERLLDEIACDQLPIDLQVDSVEHTTAYYQCVFFVCPATAPLLAVRSACGRALRHKQARPYLPHLSAIYGSLDEAEREAVATDLRAMMPLNLHLDTLGCVDTSGDDPRDWAELFAPISLKLRHDPERSE